MGIVGISFLVFHIVTVYSFHIGPEALLKIIKALVLCRSCLWVSRPRGAWGRGSGGVEVLEGKNAA